MKKKENVFLLICMIGTLSLGLTSCSKSDDESDGGENHSAYERQMIEKLSDTSWKMYKKVGSTGKSESAYGTLTFSSEKEDAKHRVCFFINGDGKGTDYFGSWWMSDNKLMMLPSGVGGVILSIDNISPVVAHFGGEVDIEQITDSKLVLSSSWTTTYYNKVNYTEGSASSGGGGGSQGGGASGEEIAFVNLVFRATKTSITADFYTNVKAASATVKYGTTSPSKTLSSTITDKQIRATATGLKAGTKYYFSCTVRKDGVEKTYPTTPFMTNY